MLETSGSHFGRTDPTTDPGGQNNIFAMKLAEKYYRQSGLAQKILGDQENLQQVFADGGVPAPLASGQVDAAEAYESAAISMKLPCITMPHEIDLNDPQFAPQPPGSSRSCSARRGKQYSSTTATRRQTSSAANTTASRAGHVIFRSADLPGPNRKAVVVSNGARVIVVQATIPPWQGLTDGFAGGD
ncbi:substrate-binding domain-containing protein [Paraburkholderia hospita]|uniref:substrate-binding domain-containing protein n=1 Tax=Paraburkholderia hospita TaxID=169430 RepID=UPI003ECF676D